MERGGNVKTEKQTIAGPAGSLEALLHLPDGDPRGALVICHPHPQYGGSMYSNVVDALAEGALDAGFAALRFNFRGVGLSAGDYDGGNGEADDAKAALEAVCGMDAFKGLPVAIAGYSFGGGIALRTFLADDSIPRAVAVAPAVASVEAPTGETRPYFLIFGSEDRLTVSARTSGWMADAGKFSELSGADHFFSGFEPRISRLVADFFARRDAD